MTKATLVVFLGLTRALCAAEALSPAAAAAATVTPVAELPPSPCRVQARNEHTQAGGTCPAGELMTGIEKVSPLTLHCAPIDVRCDAPTRFLAAEPPPTVNAVPATPERNVELLPPPPAEDAKN